VFGEHLGKLGRSLGGSVDSFNRAVGSLEQQVLPSARRFESLGLRVTRSIETIEPIESLTRTPRAEPPERDASDEPDSQDA
jgi:DNA recombination protein RmuC